MPQTKVKAPIFHLEKQNGRFQHFHYFFFLPEFPFSEKTIVKMSAFCPKQKWKVLKCRSFPQDGQSKCCSFLIQLLFSLFFLVLCLCHFRDKGGSGDDLLWELSRSPPLSTLSHRLQLWLQVPLTCLWTNSWQQFGFSVTVWAIIYSNSQATLQTSKPDLWHGWECLRKDKLWLPEGGRAHLTSYSCR